MIVTGSVRRGNPMNPELWLMAAADAACAGQAKAGFPAWALTGMKSRDICRIGGILEI
jgi:hypothetical protein